MFQSESLATLVDELKKLPGVGTRTAERLAFHILNAPAEQARALADAISDVKTKITQCSICCGVTEADPCRLCANEHRDRGLVCVVEKPSSVVAIEKGGQFSGLYHVLHGLLSPLEGIGPDDLTIGKLLKRVKDGTVREVILATSPTVDGSATALYIAKVIKPFGVKITQLAQGVPAGGDIEFAGQATLARAIERRTEL